ncbi:MAG TPA: hypothetical protein VG347_12205 [Verrucomicrobiae bacterium]|nr:hypothetical protein [Verrucomicrobiae bacterium]
MYKTQLIWCQIKATGPSMQLKVRVALTLEILAGRSEELRCVGSVKVWLDRQVRPTGFLDLQNLSKSQCFLILVDSQSNIEAVSH